MSQQQIDSNLEILLRIGSLRNQSERQEKGWKFLHMKHGIEIHTSVLAGNPVKSCLGIAYLEARVDELMDICASVENIPQYDPFFVEGRVLERPAPGHEVSYSCYAPGLPLSKRDFVLVEFHHKEGETSVIVSFSVEHPGAPPVPGRVRANMFASGYVFRPVLVGETVILPDNSTRVVGEDEAGKFVEATYVVSLDPGGWVPTFVVNFVAGDEPLVMHRIRDIVSKRRKAVMS